MKLYKSRGFTIGREEFAIGVFIEKEKFVEKFSERHFELQVKSKFLIEADEKELALYEKQQNTVDADFENVDDGRDALIEELKKLGVTDKEIGKKKAPALTKMLEAKKAEAKEVTTGSDGEGSDGEDLTLGDE